MTNKHSIIYSQKQQTTLLSQKINIWRPQKQFVLNKSLFQTVINILDNKVNTCKSIGLHGSLESKTPNQITFNMAKKGGFKKVHQKLQ